MLISHITKAAMEDMEPSGTCLYITQSLLGMTTRQLETMMVFQSLSLRRTQESCEQELLDPSDNSNLPGWRSDVEWNQWIKRFSPDLSAQEGNDQSTTRQWRMAQTSPPAGVFRHKTQPGVSHSVAGLASQSRHPRAGEDCSTNPPHHQRLRIYFQSRAESHTRTAGLWDKSCRTCPRSEKRGSGGPTSQSEDVLTNRDRMGI
jgi:hypothetical protein